MSSISSFLSGKSKSAPSSSASSIKEAKPSLGPATSEIYTTPGEGCKPTKKWEYTPEQLEMISQLRKYTASFILPESDPYFPWEARFLADPGCHPRYMRAAKWKLEDGKRRIKGSVDWRREFKPELIKPGDVAVEAETGKIILTGFDHDARPVLYLRPGRENTEPSPRQIRHMIYHLERAIDLMPPGQEQVAIIVDYKSATSSSMPSIGTGRKVLSILQNHYVERLGRGLVVNTSWWIGAFFAGISPLMDPLTRDKIRFNPKLEELVPASQLDSEFGGTYHFEFDHKKYWDTLTEFCHIAEDGTRHDAAGQGWYPPLGNGITAALAGLVPKQGANTSGDVVPATDGEADKAAAERALRTVDGGEVKGEAGKGEMSEAQKIADTHGESGAEAGESGGADGLPNGEGRAKEDGSGVDGATDGLAGLAVGGTAAAAAAAATRVQAVRTKSGAPVGEAHFDHPPTEEEKEIARKSMDGGR